MQKEAIIIVGAGPVGMTIAEMLTKHGIPVTVLEKNNSPSKEWRASTFHAGTLELLESLGVADELMKRGLIADKVQYRDRQTGLYAEFDFRHIQSETKYPFRLQLPQSTYVQVLYERLQECPHATIRFNAELVEVEQDESGVTAVIQTPDGIERLHTPYLLGADGARSAVRKQLGLTFDGYTYEERFLLVGTPVAFDRYIPDLAYVNYVSDPEEFLFILRVPEAWRLLYPIPAGITDEEALDDENIQRSLQRALKTEDRFPIVERMIYRVHQRVAETFHKGRVILLGDAAHINSPMGGLGLNNGIHDAVDLGRRLIRILQGQSDQESELTTYTTARRKVALDYVKEISEKNTKVMKEKDPEYRLRLQKEMAEQAKDPQRCRHWLLRSAMIASIREQGIGEPPAS